MAAPTLISVSLADAFIAHYPARIQVIGVRADAQIQPAGNHLRWFPPKSVGYAPGGYEIYRADTARWAELRTRLRHMVQFDRRNGSLSDGPIAGAINWSSKNRTVQIHPELLLVTAAQDELVKTPVALRIIPRQVNSSLLLRFSTPIIYCEIGLHDLRPTALRFSAHFFQRSLPVASARLSPLITVEHTGITDVHLPLQFAEIRHIAWVTEDNVIAAISEDRSNPVLQHLDVPRGAGEAYQLTAGDLATGIRNRTLTANDLPAFQQRYPQSQVQRLIEEIQWLLVNPPGARRPVPEQHGMLYQEVEVAPIVELALLDPNIARLAGLYWVDRKTPAGGSALYLIAGVYPGRPEKYLRGLCFVSPNSSLPAFAGPPHARQIPGMVYNGRTPLGKAGLELQVMSLSLGRNRAVLFDAVRHAGGRIFGSQRRGYRLCVPIPNSHCKTLRFQLRKILPILSRQSTCSDKRDHRSPPCQSACRTWKRPRRRRT